MTLDIGKFFGKDSIFSAQEERFEQFVTVDKVFLNELTYYSMDKNG